MTAIASEARRSSAFNRLFPSRKMHPNPVAASLPSPACRLIPGANGCSLARTQFVIARSVAKRQSLRRDDASSADEIAALRSQ